MIKYCLGFPDDLVKNLPVMWEIWIQSLGQEDTLVKGMATHSDMLAWKMPWSEESGRLQSMGLQREHNWRTKHKVLLAPWEKSYDKPSQHIKRLRHYFSNKGPHSQSYGFSNSHVQMWELDHKEGWALKNWCFWTIVLEKTLKIPLDSMEIKPLILKEINPEYLLKGLMLKLKLQYFSHLMRRTSSLEKILMLREIEGRRRRVTDDEIFGCHHWLNEHEFEQTLGYSEGQGSLMCYSPWVYKNSDILSDWTT